MRRLFAVGLLILVLTTGCGAKDTVTITADPDSYTPLMSSVQGITLTPDFVTKTDYKNLVYIGKPARVSLSTKEKKLIIRVKR